MPVDRTAAETFIWSAARLVDRHRYAMLFLGGSADPMLAALSGYRNPDGGFGHALEPDLRCPRQPTRGDAVTRSRCCTRPARLDSELARGARAWIASIAAADGGIPFALPGFEPYPHAPWWSSAPGSFLTFALAAVLHAGGMSGDEWLDRATGWCWREVDAPREPAGYWLKFACAFLDAVPDEERARAAIASLAPRIDPAASRRRAVPRARRSAPSIFRPGRAAAAGRSSSTTPHEADLDAVEAGQQEDGGWMFDWLAWSPEQTTAWRGIVTIRALTWLRDNGRLAGNAARSPTAFRSRGPIPPTPLPLPPDLLVRLRSADVAPPDPADRSPTPPPSADPPWRERGKPPAAPGTEYT